MATRKSAAQADAGLDVSKIDDDREYRAKLKRPIQVGRTWVRPGGKLRLKGRVIKENADAIVEYADA